LTGKKLPPGNRLIAKSTKNGIKGASDSAAFYTLTLVSSNCFYFDLLIRKAQQSYIVERSVAIAASSMNKCPSTKKHLSAI
jgi:hypothetical protein